MKTEVKNLFIKKRYIELECLGIQAFMYYNAVKLIERHVYVVIKDDKFFIFKKHDFGLHDNNDKSKYFDAEKIVDLLAEIFGLSKVLAHNIYTEWIREKIIYARMSEKANEYWDFLCLPQTYVDINENEGKYNF